MIAVTVTIFVVGAGSLATVAGWTTQGAYMLVDDHVIAQADASAKAKADAVQVNLDAKLVALTAVVQQNATTQAAVIQDRAKRKKETDAVGAGFAFLICDRANGEPIGVDCLWFKRNGEVRKRIKLANMKALQQALAEAARKRRKR